MTTAKNDNYNLKIFIYFGGGGFFDFRWGGNKNLVWREGIFPGGGGGMIKFLAGGRGLPHPPSRENSGMWS